MTRWLLDTNIISELRRPKPGPKVTEFIRSQPLEGLFVSIVTFAEIRFGIELLPDATRRSDLNDWLAHKVRPMFEQRVLIAATAQHHGLTVVSRDTKEYLAARVDVFNPWVDVLRTT